MPSAAEIGGQRSQKRLLTELANGKRATNGFIDRILFAMTKSNGKPRWNEDEVRDDLDREWERILNRLLSVECVVNEDKEPIPTVMRFTADAKRRLYEWQHENAALCDNEMSDNVVSFFCRLEIYVLRFCLILRMVRWAVSDGEPRPSNIENQVVATQLCHRRRPQRVCRKSREHTPRGSNPGCQ